MDNSNITQFFTPDNVGLFKDLIMSGAIVMLVTQGTKGFIDNLFVKVKILGNPSTSSYVGFLSLVQSAFFMFVFNTYSINLTNIYLTVINACLLYFGCTKGFDFVFKKISFNSNEETK